MADTLLIAFAVALGILNVIFAGVNVRNAEKNVEVAEFNHENAKDIARALDRDQRLIKASKDLVNYHFEKLDKIEGTLDELVRMHEGRDCHAKREDCDYEGDGGDNT